MSKRDVLHRIETSRIIAIIRENHHETAFKAAMACIEGGIDCLEVALTTPRGLDLIKRIIDQGGVTVGAGTVLDAETAKAAIDAGATFCLSPSVDTAMIRMCSNGSLSPALTQAGIECPLPGRESGPFSDSQPPFRTSACGTCAARSRQTSATVPFGELGGMLRDELA